MSRIYAGGVKATAIANIKTDVATYISFDADGRKVLNIDGLIQYLETQFAAIRPTSSTSHRPPPQRPLLPPVRSDRTIAESLNNQIKPEH